MKNIKFIIGFSIFGFLISFVSGFASNSTFLKMLLNAFIFLFVFAFLGAAIVFLWDKFLSTEFQNAEYVTSKNDNSSKTAGQTVDITIQDEALQNDDNASQFFVGSNHQMLTKEDVAEKVKNNNAASDSPEKVDSWGADIKTVSVDKKQDVSDENNSGFVPVALAENPANISSSEAKSGVEYKNIDNVIKNSKEVVLVQKNNKVCLVGDMTGLTLYPANSSVLTSLRMNDGSYYKRVYAGVKLMEQYSQTKKEYNISPGLIRKQT